MLANDIRRELQEMADAEKAKAMRRFFKTGPGQYGEGDVFLGITVPESRKVAKRYSHVGLGVVRALLASAVHEERMVALLNRLSAHPWSEHFYAVCEKRFFVLRRENPPARVLEHVYPPEQICKSCNL